MARLGLCLCTDLLRLALAMSGLCTDLLRLALAMSGLCINCLNIPLEGQSSLSYSSITIRGSLTLLKRGGRGQRSGETDSGQCPVHHWACVCGQLSGKNSSGRHLAHDAPGVVKDG